MRDDENSADHGTRSECGEDRDPGFGVPTHHEHRQREQAKRGDRSARHDPRRQGEINCE